jgi:hypothetical protein
MMSIHQILFYVLKMTLIQECSKYYGRDEEFHEDNHPQYAKILTSCGNAHLSELKLYNIVLHEFAHTMGLGHAYNIDGDLMCGGAVGNRTCYVSPSDDIKISDLDTNALLWIYGTDGSVGITVY